MSDAGAKLIADAITGLGTVYVLVNLMRFLFGGRSRD